MFKHENACECRYQERCSNKLCKFKHLKLNSEEPMIFCKKCNYNGNSETDLKHHTATHEQEQVEFMEESVDEEEESFRSYVEAYYPVLHQKFNTEKIIN